MKIQLIVVLLINLLTVKFVRCDENAETRQLRAYLNPNCTVQFKNETERCDNFVFVHIEAESELNTIHYLWNLRGGKPSALVAKTSKNASLTVNWEKFDGVRKAFNFSEDPEYVYSTVINTVFVFNDTLDKGDINDASVTDIAQFDPQSLTWTLSNVTEHAGLNKVTAEVHATTRDNGTFSIMFTAYGAKKHGDDLPHLYHGPDAMQIDIIANRVRSNYTSPRIAIELLTMASEDRREGASVVHRIRNLDDEFTPGIFDVFHVLSPRSNNGTKGGFIQFRPVCYNSPNRTVSSSTELTGSEPKSLGDDNEEFRNSLPYMFFHKATMVNRLKEAINVTFGMTNDGFYSRTNYISFSYLIGLGAPLKEGLSLAVIVFASIGLGVPLLVLLVGGTCVAVKRYSN